jgi:hypothetical protein
MPKVSRNSAAEHTDRGPVEEWSEEVDDYAINFVRFAVGIDSTPLLEGLPGDREEHAADAGGVTC